MFFLKHMVLAGFFCFSGVSGFMFLSPFGVVGGIGLEYQGSKMTVVGQPTALLRTCATALRIEWTW
jgi:hypothetical protein